MNLLSTVLFVCVLLSNVLSQTCSVGNYYKSKSRSTVSNIGGYWYLNVEAPATSSGSIDQYKIGYYDNNLSDRTYYATFAIWKPTGGGSYEKDNNTVLLYRFYFNGENKEKTDRYRKRDLQTERPNLSSPAGVRKGSVIGVYLCSSSPIPLIGNFYNNKYFYAGVCRTAGNVSAIKIDCSNGSNVQDQILHVEVLISK